MNNTPLVSVIVSTYNSEKFFQGKIEDLLNQTILPKLEIIVINSGSKQNEDAIIQPYLERYECIRYIHTEERETIYKAWNRGIKIAKGKYITNANTDDRLKNNAFEILAEELEKNDSIGLVFANQYISNSPNEIFDEIRRKRIWPIPKYDYLVQLDRCVVLSQPMWRASIHHSQNIWFDERYEICGDHEFDINISQKYSIKYLPMVLGVFYVDKKKSNVSLRDMKRVEFEKHNMTKRYIEKYIEEIDDAEITKIKSEFESLIKIPIYFLRGSNVILKYLFPHTHRFTHEFIYFVMALIYKREGNYKRAKHYCEKLLRKNKSQRVIDLVNTL